eukprot:502928_1
MSNCCTQANYLVKRYVIESTDKNVTFSIQIIFDFFGKYGLILRDLDLSKTLHNPTDISVFRDAVTLFISLNQKQLHRYIDTQYCISRVIAKFTDSILIKSTQIIKSDQHFEQVMHNISAIVKHINDKDIFEHDYQNYFANRILNNLYDETSIEKETETIHNLTLSNQCRQRLLDMIKDIEHSKQTMKDFNTRYQEQISTNFQFDLNVMLCRTGAWPTHSIHRIKMPLDFNYAMNLFKSFREMYYNKNTFVMDKGNADIRIEFNDKIWKILNVSTYQMIILLLFNRKNIWRFDEIFIETHIPKIALIDAILTMAHPKIKILRKSPNTKDIKDNHKFQINSNYSNVRKRIIIPSLNSFDALKESNDRNWIVSRRNNQIDTEIVKIMKVRLTLTELELIEEIIKLFNKQKRFIPCIKQITNSINRLIKTVYIERDEMNKRILHYLI